MTPDEHAAHAREWLGIAEQWWPREETEAVPAAHAAAAIAQVHATLACRPLLAPQVVVSGTPDAGVEVRRG
jgi:hypothetical protein